MKIKETLLKYLHWWASGLPTEEDRINYQRKQKLIKKLKRKRRLRR